MDKPSAKPETHAVGSYKYPSIDNLSLTSTRVWGDEEHPSNANWYIQEKIDGSQLTIIVNPEYNEADSKSQPLLFYNKGGLISYTNKVFLKAINMLTHLAKSSDPSIKKFDPKLAYHGEAVCSTQHNVAKYEHVPRYYFIVYDITTIDGAYLDPREVEYQARVRLGLEVVPLLAINSNPKISPYAICKDLVGRMMEGTIKSILGGAAEGIVLKHNTFIDKKGKTVATKLKFVTPAFRESHAMKNHREKATPETAVQEVGKAYSIPARFHKAVQHLRDADKLKFDMTDVIKLKEELDDDLEREVMTEVMTYLWAELAPHVKRACRVGFDDWYRDHLGHNKEAATMKSSAPHYEDPAKPV